MYWESDTIALYGRWLHLKHVGTSWMALYFLTVVIRPSTPPRRQRTPDWLRPILKSSGAWAAALNSYGMDAERYVIGNAISTTG